MGQIWTRIASAMLPTSAFAAATVAFNRLFPMTAVNESLISRLPSLTSSELQMSLQEGTLTSRQLVEACLEQIERHNTAGMRLHALISVLSPKKALALADTLDHERKEHKTRGKYHGMPIIIKDTINTTPELGMPTTLGTPALLTSRPKQNSKLADTLEREGIIVLGKANMSEFGATKTGKARAGYSPVGGQTQSAYIEGGVDPNDSVMGHTNPGGSSSGSAVGVAAGFVPWSIGGETDGSLVTPASRSSLYALKPTINSVSSEGVFMLTKSLDSIGGMAKSVDDLVDLTEILLSSEASSPKKELSNTSNLKWEDLAIGFVDPELWRLPTGLLEPTEKYKEQTLKAYHDARDLVSSHGAKVVYPVEIKPASAISYDGQSGYAIIRNAEFKTQLNAYLADLEYSPVSTLSDIIRYNEEHPEIAFSPESPDQAKLISMDENDTEQAFLEEAVVQIRKLAGPDNIDRVLGEHELDVIIAPSDSPISGVSALAGYPIGTMPLGYLEESGRPFGLTVLASAGQEHKILAVMRCWERSNPERRRVPLALRSWESKL